jgi:MORN repeat
MTWADGSSYFGIWKDGIQNGLGIMIFASGVKKAGIFKDNVLSELLLDHQTVNICEQMFGEFNDSFKNELLTYLREMNPEEDQREYLLKELKKN